MFPAIPPLVLLVGWLRGVGVMLSLTDDGQLRWRDSRGVMTDDLLAAMRQHRDELVEMARLELLRRRLGAQAIKVGRTTQAPLERGEGDQQ